MEETSVKKQRSGPSGAIWLGIFFLLAMGAGAFVRLPQVGGNQVPDLGAKSTYRSTGVRVMGSLQLSEDRIPVFGGEESLALFSTSSSNGSRAPILAAKVATMSGLYEAGTAAAPPSILSQPNGLIWLSPDGYYYRQSEGVVSKIASTPPGTGTPRIAVGSSGSVVERLAPPAPGSTSWGASTLSWFSASGQPLASLTLQGTAVTSLAAGGGAAAAGTMMVRDGEPAFGLTFFSTAGKLDWEYSAGKMPLLYLAFNSDAKLLAAASSQDVAGFSPLGERLWLAKTQGVSGLAFTGRNEAVVLTERGELASYDTKGKRTWTRTLSGKPIFLGQVAGGGLVAATSAGVIGVRADGNSTWFAAPDSAVKWVAVSPSAKRIAVVTVKNTLLVYQVEAR